ncbi:glycosyltransferase family 2 protein [Rapidithrix thailandica]|uniref:Glycosyltransferase family 2 protein n=1 Tax=Rapidithrix thailandica TaxID=413964 RepID=A0AAW9S3E3_9BACT
MKLSAVVITYNEEKNIERCLQSLQNVADEILVVDSFSTDRTEEICAKYKVRFITNPFEGHIQQKNWATGQATYDYVLSLDADEALSSELEANILELKTAEEVMDGYWMNRLTSYCGKWMHYIWYPDRKLRLWNRHKGHWGGENPHDKFLLKDGSSTGLLQGDLLHHTYHSIAEHVEQINKFSEIVAKEKFKKGKRTSLLGVFVHAIGKFISKYFFKRGFMDGTSGLIISVMSFYDTFLKYIKLYMLQKNGK